MPATPTEAASQDSSYYAPDARWRAFLPLAIVSIASTLNSSVINVSLPVISQELRAGIGVVEWVILAFLLAITSLLMISGRLGDLLGRRQVYQGGILLFTTASALCGFSNSITMLIVFRVLQGIGAALTVSVGPAIIGEIFPPNQRGKALGILGTTVSVGLSVGPALGGFITGWLGWRYIFFLNLPLGLLGAVLVGRNLRPSAPSQSTHFDIPGSFTMAAGLFGLMLVLSRGGEWGWGSQPIFLLLAGALVFLALFFWLEHRNADPVLDLTLFDNSIFRSATFAGFLAFCSMFVQTFLLPFYLIQLRGFSPACAGLFLMAVPSVMAVVAPTSGALSDRIGTRGLCSVGLAIQGISFVLLATLDADSSQGFIVAALLVLGLGIGMFNPPNNSDLLSSVPRERLGNASGMMGLTRTLGMVCGVAMSSAIFTGVRNYILSSANPGSDEVTAQFAFVSGLRWAFWAAAGLAWLGMIMVWGRESRKRRKVEEQFIEPC